MKKFVCDICGGSLIVDVGGTTATCECCGVKHSVERMRENNGDQRQFSIVGNVNVAGVAPVENLLIRARAYWDSGDGDKATEYYNRVLDLSPDNEEARHALEAMTISEGMICEGTVSRIMQFGCFVRLKPSGKEGLVHISKITDHKITSVSDGVKVGQNVRVQIMEIDEMGRLNLSIKDA